MIWGAKASIAPIRPDRTVRCGRLQNGLLILSRYIKNDDLEGQGLQRPKPIRSDPPAGPAPEWLPALTALLQKLKL